jgi:large subunit ribosomal protein L29
LKLSEIRVLSDEELVKKIEDTRQELFNLRIRAATRQLASNQEIVKAKKTIARMLTILRERELGKV